MEKIFKSSDDNITFKKTLAICTRLQPRYIWESFRRGMEYFDKRAANGTFRGFEKEKESKWKGPFYFIQGADTQLGMIESYILKKENPGWEPEIKLVTKAIGLVNKMQPRPRFFIVCGDLVDAFPGTKNRKAQEQDFIKLFSKLNPDIPLVCVCGNHDVGNTPTPEAVEGYRELFGDDYFSFFVGGVMFIVINSQFYEDPSLVQDFADKQDSWLDKQLKEAKHGGYKHVIVFQHIPWFLKTPDEDKCYFNFTKDIRLKMLQKFNDANVNAIFCGHYHRNAGGFYKKMELVVTSAIGAPLGNDPSGYRIVKVLENCIQHKYYSLEELPTYINMEDDTSVP